MSMRLQDRVRDRVCVRTRHGLQLPDLSTLPPDNLHPTRIPTPNIGVNGSDQWIPPPFLYCYIEDGLGWDTTIQVDQSEASDGRNYVYLYEADKRNDKNEMESYVKSFGFEKLGLGTFPYPDNRFATAEALNIPNAGLNQREYRSHGIGTWYDSDGEDQAPINHVVGRGGSNKYSDDFKWTFFGREVLRHAVPHEFRTFDDLKDVLTSDHGVQEDSILSHQNLYKLEIALGMKLDDKSINMRHLLSQQFLNQPDFFKGRIPGVATGETVSGYISYIRVALTYV